MTATAHPGPLSDPATQGISLWLDDLSKGQRLTSGNLLEIIRWQNIVSVTTNPSIFAAAMADESYEPHIAPWPTAAHQWMRSWHHVAQLKGRDPAEIVGKYHGMPGNLILQLVDPTLSADRIRELHQVLLDLETSDTDDVRALPGDATAMGTLPAERWAIVTGCSTMLANARLNAAGLPTPTTMITADDIAH